MVNYKNIPVLFDTTLINELANVVRIRKDNIVITGVTMRVERFVWQSEPGGYDGRYVHDKDEYFNEKKVVVNKEHNKKRRETLERLRRIGGAQVIRVLLKPMEIKTYMVEDSGQVITKDDDLSFELSIEQHRREVVSELLRASSPSVYSNLFKGVSPEEASKICLTLWGEYKEQYLNLLRVLSERDPSQLIRLANLLLKGRITTYPALDEVLKLITPAVLQEADIVELVKFSITKVIIGQLKGISKRIIISRMTFDNAVSVINNLSVYDIPLSRDNTTFIIGILSYLKKSHDKDSIKKLSLKRFLEYVWGLKNRLPKEKRSDKAFDNISRAVGLQRIFLELIDEVEQLFVKIEELLAPKEWPYQANHRSDVLEALLFFMASIRSETTKNLLFKLAKRLIANKRIAGSYISSVIMELLKHKITEDDLNELKELYLNILRRYEGELKWLKDMEKDLLVDIALVLKELDPSTVYVSWKQFIRGERPFVSREIRRKLKKLERRRKK